METNTILPVSGKDTSEQEPKDYTKFIWLGVIALIFLMMVGIYMGRKPRPVTSMVRVSHILISFDSSDPVGRGRAYERISELRERILAGESFSKLAKAYSDDTVSKKRGGDLGWASRGTYAAEFDEYCWKGEIGKISDIIQTQYGFHIIRVDDRHISEAERYEAEIEQEALELLEKEEDAGNRPGSHET